MKKLILVLLLLCCATQEQHLLQYRQWRAQQFFIEAGWPASVYQQHLAAIDFTAPVFTTTLTPNTKVLRWQKNPQAQGNYFAPIDQHHSQLGIYSKQRIKCYYRIKNATTVLVSTPKNTVDFWSDPPRSYVVQGGGTQYVAANPKDFTITTCLKEKSH